MKEIKIVERSEDNLITRALIRMIKRNIEQEESNMDVALEEGMELLLR